MIGELAELLGVSRDTLRIYEEQGLLKPMRDENGFRVYSEADIRSLQDYGRQQGLKLTGRLHTYFLYQYEKDGATGFHIAMYAPLAEESEE